MAVVLFVVLTLMLLLSVAGIVVCASSGAYVDGGEELRDSALSLAIQNERYRAERYYELSEASGDTENNLELNDLREHFTEGNTNYFFVVTDAEGTELFRSGTGDYQYSEADSIETWTEAEAEASVSVTRTFSSAAERQVYLEQLNGPNKINYEYQYETTDADGNTLYKVDVTYTGGKWQGLTLTSYVRADVSGVKDDIYYALLWADRLIAWRYGLIAVAAALLLGAIAVLCSLLAAAGRHEGEVEPRRSWFDRIPLDLLLVFYVALGGITAAVGEGCSVRGWIAVAVFCVVAALVWVLLALALLMSFAVRVKTQKLWKNTVIYWLCSRLWRFFRRLGRGAAYLAKSLPLYWKAGLCWVGLSLVELFFLAALDSGDFFVFWLVEKLVLTPLLLLLVVNLRRLQAGARRIAAGEDYTINLKYMVGDFRAHGETLNAIRDGLQTEVEARVKSERMKAELITNVSHDIKTPLTSIVSYVDLLQKEELGSDAAREYAAVLARQAQRLKKLTEDLVEASKASTGNIAVHLERTDLNVLLEQAAGEFADRLAEKHLELRLNCAQETLAATADGRLLWRVISNLMSNISKYALEGTRVYLTGEALAGRAVLTFRNISRYALNVSGDELMERFVRGDKSRSTEGSGLGLSIARSLTELQNGTFDILIDGDLFKVCVTLPLA